MRREKNADNRQKEHVLLLKLGMLHKKGVNGIENMVSMDGAIEKLSQKSVLIVGLYSVPKYITNYFAQTSARVLIGVIQELII